MEQFLCVIVVFVCLLHRLFSNSFHLLCRLLFLCEERLPQVRFADASFGLSCKRIMSWPSI